MEKEEKKEEEENHKVTIENFEENNKLQEIEQVGEYIQLKGCLNKYISYFKMLKDTEQETIEEAQNAIKSMVPEFVINELNLANDNLYNKIEIPDKHFRINKIYQSMQTVSMVAYEQNTYIYAYFIEGILIDKTTHEKQDFQTIIILDRINGTFLIIPEIYIKQKNINISENNNLSIYKEEKIPDNFYNVYDSNYPSNEKICQNYFLELKDNLRYDIEYAYKLLDNNYKQNKFSNIDEFKIFIMNNFRDIMSRRMEKYSVNEDENLRYICQDQYKNIYIFNEISPLNYKIILDTYSIDLPEFTNQYNTASEERKVSLNLGKIIEAINYKDYKYVYNKLDETFKNNNFSEINKLEEYIKNNFYNKNSIKEMDCKREGNVYICNLKINNKENEQEIKQITILVKLLENTNFVISFSI